MFDCDEKLKNNREYENIILYASVYLNYINSIDSANLGLYNSKTLPDKKLKMDILDMSVQDILQKIETENNIISIEEKSKIGLANKSGYTPSKAASYAIKHGNSYNIPAYAKFSNDCTNFVSQCIKAGGKSFKYPKNYKKLKTIYPTRKYWYSYHYTFWAPYHRYKVSTSFIRVNDFYSFCLSNGAKKIECNSIKQLQLKAKLGDVVQLARKSNGNWYHSIIISKEKKGNWRYAGHNNDHSYAKLSSISNNNKFRIIRF